MSKIGIILKREYLTRVKNKSFIIMTFLGPVLITAFYAAIAFVVTRDAGDKKTKKVLFTDASGFFADKLDSVENYHFTFSKETSPENLTKVGNQEFDAMLEIKDKDLRSLDSANWLSRKTLSIAQTEKVKGYLANKVYANRLLDLGLRKGTIDSLSPKTRINMLELGDNGELISSNSTIKSGIGFTLALLIYMFIFVYGSMVMRSAIEEKTNRIVEVIVSSVKPFQMMMGKILGVALVGLTQFIAWIILSFSLIGVISLFVGSNTMQKAAMARQSMPGAPNTQAIEQMSQNGFGLETFFNLPFFQIIVIFFVFFIGGYLLYSSMFAAIGASVNQETDVQQFMFPISLPLVFGFVIAQLVVFQDPHGPMARIFSIIPFTSPIVMVVRSPFGVPWSEVLLSVALLFGTFILMVWLTGKIYRVGILMYGQKPTWKTLGKWIFTKD